MIPKRPNEPKRKVIKFLKWARLCVPKSLKSFVPKRAQMVQNVQKDPHGPKRVLILYKLSKFSQRSQSDQKGAQLVPKRVQLVPKRARLVIKKGPV